MNTPKFAWNRLLPANQVIIQFRHRLVQEPVYYLYPNEREAQRCITNLRADPDVDTSSILYKQVRDVFTSQA